LNRFGDRKPATRNSSERSAFLHSAQTYESTFHLNRRFEVVVGSPVVEAPLVPIRSASNFRGPHAAATTTSRR
jgi:hypothetical protein